MPDRRDFMSTAVLAGTALLAGCPKTPSSNEHEIRIGYISPRTGALALFGGVDNYILARIGPALDALAIPVEGRRARFRVLAKDSASVPAMAAAAAKSLIEEDRVHLVVVGSTPDTTNPVTEVCERAGVPCIGGAEDAGREVIEDGVTGLLVPTRDLDALARAVIDLLGDTERRRAMGEAGRARFEERFSFPQFVRRLGRVVAPVQGN